MKITNFAVLAASAVFAGSLFSAPSPSDDKPRLVEFAKNKLPIVFVEDNGKRVSEMMFDSLQVVDGVTNFKLTYADGTPGSVFVPVDKGGVKFRYRETEALKRMRSNYLSGNYEDAVKAGRHVVYPAVAIMGMPEDLTNVHDNLLVFVDCLLNTGRFIEAKSLMESLPLSKATSTVGKAVIAYANKLISMDHYPDAEAVLERLNFGGDNLENIDDIMDLTSFLRRSGKIDEAVKWYTKLQATPGNPRKNEAILWMAYCDIVKGNTMSAEIFFDQLKDLKKTDDEFSLKSMIAGMLLENDKKLTDALDAYAEGIVYGDVSFNWFAELYYKTGMVYKALGFPKTSNEIFEQTALLYPESNFAKLSKEQIVVIAEEPEEGEEDSLGE